MTKTKVEGNSGASRERRQRHKMDSESQQPPHACQKKKLQRAPSPARPKEVPGWSLTKIRGGLQLGVRRGVKEVKPEKGKLCGKPGLSARRKASDASNTSEDLSRDSGCPAGKLSSTDSSSELSDCASEENKPVPDGLGGETAAAGADAADAAVPARRPGEKERLPLAGDAGEESISPGDERSVGSFDSRMPASTSLAFSDLTEEFMDGMQEELLREIEELRSENDYLKDEMEELRSEMLEMRDMYMEEDLCQLQELRGQLEQTNKTCRILQYRLRKAERRSLRVAQTGQVDGELIRTLEQDVKVAKDVSIRLHNELEVVEEKRARLEQENEDLHQKLQDLDVAKQVLQNEMEKARENYLKKKGARPTTKPERKLSLQEDSSDLKCQLHFAKEESALMCKKLTKMAKDNDSMREELAKYRSLYGDLDASLSVEEVADSPHTREAEVKVHLKLVEEEANLLSRRIVELEVENRGLRAEMDEMKSQELPGGASHLVLAGGESVMELQRHLQFVEEEAELLRRSLLEMEEQNKLLMNELNRYKSQEAEMEREPASPQEGEPPSEELLSARLQIGELSGKVKKLQYENRVLLSNLQRCDLASYQHSHLAMETDAEAGDSAQCLPCPMRREGPVGGENHALGELEKKGGDAEPDLHCVRPKDYQALLAIREQSCLVSTAIQLLTSSPFRKGPPINEAPEQQGGPDIPLLEALNSRLGVLQSQILSFVERVESLGSGERDQAEGSASSVPSQARANEDQARDAAGDHKQPDFRDQSEHRVKGQDVHPGKAEGADNKENDKEEENLHKGCTSAAEPALICELQTLLSEATERARGAQEQLSQERQARRDDSHSSSQKLTQLQEEHQKALMRRDFQLQSLSLQSRLQQKFWSQEKNLMVQESQQLKQNLLLLGLKLRWFLKQWRQGKKLDGEGEDMMEVNSLKDLYQLLEDEGLASHQGDNKATIVEEQAGPAPKDRCLLEKTFKQTSGLSTTLADLKAALQDLTTELREERQGSHELTQQFARAKASWEVEQMELKSHIAQLESKTGKLGTPGEKEALDLKMALKREREEHQHLLAESYAAVMDITKQLQISERSWSREKLELLERLTQEQAQWEQMLREAQNKSSQEKTSDRESFTETDPNKSLQRRQSTSPTDSEDLQETFITPGQEVDRIADMQHSKPSPAATSLLSHTGLGELNKKNWKYLTKDTALLEKGDLFKTWDCPTTTSSFAGLDLGKECIQRSYTAPDKTGIRIYYSPPVRRRMEGRLSTERSADSEGTPSAGSQESQDAEEPSTSTYDSWLSKFSKQHRDLLENGSAAVTSSFHDLQISGNLSDDMKEMTNCVRQAIRSSSLERKCKDTASQTVVVASTGTQTVQFVSVGLQTDGPRHSSLQSKSWSPRVSTLASNRTRQISTSLEKVQSRIDRPCCSPKYGSPKLQRRVSTSSSKLDGSKDRSLWNLHHRGHSGSAWARSTTTRDSPVLSGLNDGLSSLFSVVEHSGSVESLWRSEVGVKPAGKPSGEAGSYRYGIVHEFFRNVCGRSPGAGERPPREGSAVDEVNPECPASAPLAGNDNITKIVNKRFMKQAQRDEQGQSSKEQGSREMSTSSSALEQDTACDCTSHSLTSCFSRPSRSTTRHSLGQCKLRPLETTVGEERGETGQE